MRRLARLAGVLGALCSAQALGTPAARLDLAAYQDREGAITVRIGGDFSDPYFALRALLSARQAGADIAHPARAFIAWLLPRQQVDGSFPRFCRTPGSPWQACAEADADDAVLALWAQLLYASAPCKPMLPSWRRSAAHALRHLGSLRDPQRATYRISRRHDSSLLMDNAEIHAALTAIARRQACMGARAPARQTRRSAARLRAAIGQVFLPAPGQAWRVSTQDVPATGFYPHQAAQVYPLLFGLSDGFPARAAMRAWLAEHEHAWLARSGDSSPWGLVALAAQQAGAPAAALRWLERAAPLRHGQHWTVLEEAAFQSLCGLHRAQAVACRGLPASQAEQ